MAFCQISCHEYWLQHLISVLKRDFETKQHILDNWTYYNRAREELILKYSGRYAIVAASGIEIMLEKPESRGFGSPTSTAFTGDSFCIGSEKTNSPFFGWPEELLEGIEYIENVIRNTETELTEIPKMIAAYEKYLLTRSEYIDNHLGEKIIISPAGLRLADDAKSPHTPFITISNCMTIGQESQWDTIILKKKQTREAKGNMLSDTDAPLRN